MNTGPKYYGTPIYTRTYELLKGVATKHQKPIGYAPIFKILGLKPGNHASKEAGILLGEISEQARKVGKPMLSALVVSMADPEKRPGSGFFTLATQFGKLPAGASESEEDEFWRRELEAVYSTEW